MDTYIGLFKKDDMGYYICGCGHFGIKLDLLNNHRSRSIDSICINGMKLTDDLLYKCICGKEFNDPRESERHYKTRSCMINAIDKKSRSCKECKLTCRNIGELHIHEKTKRHIEKLSGNYMNLYCNICKIHCTTQNQIKEHLETKKHKDMITLGKTADEKIPLSCDVCGIKCTTQRQIKSHLQTKKHKNLYKQYIFQKRMDETKPDQETLDELELRKREVKRYICDNDLY